jgi:O-antigen/teichoic acid export membrane protein
MSLTRKIAHNNGIQIIGKVLSTLVGLFAIGLLLRTLGDTRFGWYTTAFAFLQFGAIIIDFGMIPVSAQMLGQGKYSKKKLFGNLLAFRFWSAIILLGFLPLLGLLFPYPAEVKIAMFLLSLSFLGVMLNQVFIALYQNELKMHLPAIGELLNRVLLLIGVIILKDKVDNFFPLMIWISFSSLAYTSLLWGKARKLIKITFRYDKKIWKEIVTKAWPIAISILFNVMYLKGDVLILAHFRDQAEVGIYGAAYRVLDILTQTAMMLMGIMLPILSASWISKISGKFQGQLRKAFEGMMLFAFPMIAGILLLSTQIMELVGGSEFNSSGAALSILAVALLGVYAGAVFGHAAVAIDKQKQTIPIYLGTALLTLGGYLYFIPKFGFLGAAGMTVFSELLVGVSLGIYILYVTKTRLHLLPIAKIFLSTLLMTLTLIPLLHLNLLLLIPIGAVSYAFWILVTQAVPLKMVKEIMNYK